MPSLRLYLDQREGPPQHLQPQNGFDLSHRLVQLLLKNSTIISILFLPLSEFSFPKCIALGTWAVHCPEELQMGGGICLPSRKVLQRPFPLRSS